jgi:hypothetical protein
MYTTIELLKSFNKAGSNHSSDDYNLLYKLFLENDEGNVIRFTEEDLKSNSDLLKAHNEQAALSDFLHKITTFDINGRVSLAKYSKLHKQMPEITEIINYYYTYIGSIMVPNSYRNYYFRLKSEHELLKERLFNVYKNKNVKNTASFFDLINLAKGRKNLLPAGLSTTLTAANVRLLFKIILLDIFKEWKANGYITSTIIDDISIVNNYLTSRIMTTLKTAIFNCYNKFDTFSENIEITDEHNLNRSVSIISPTKSNNILHGCTINFLRNDALYEFYNTSNMFLYNTLLVDFRGSINSISHFDFVRLSSEIKNRMWNANFNNPIHRNFDLSKYILTLGYGYRSGMNGEFSISGEEFSLYLTYNMAEIINDFGKHNDLDSCSIVKNLPKHINQSLLSSLNAIGFSVSNQENNVNTSPLKLYTMRRNMYVQYDLNSIKDTLTLTFDGLQRGYISKYNTIIHMLFTYYNLIKFILNDLLECGRFPTEVINVFMPIIFFIEEMCYLNQQIQSFSYSYQYERNVFFSILGVIDSEEKFLLEPEIKSLICNSAISDIDMETNLLARKNANLTFANLDKLSLCNSYDMYIKNLGFNTDDICFYGQGTLYVHFANLLKDLLKLIDDNYIGIEDQNIWDLTFIREYVKAIDEALDDK